MADIFEIAGRIHSTSQEEVTTVANEVLDERLNKKQDVINREIDEDLNTPSSGLKDRVETLEHEVSFEGDIQVENTPQGVVSGSGKVTTANAVRGAIDMATGYFECGTAAGTAAKVVTGAAVAGFVLPSVGGCLKIKMTNRNTADDATLNINGTGAMPLFYDGQRASAANSWDAGETIEVYFDGTNYMANNVAGGGDGGIFDISAYNAGATYADLSTAIAAVPVAKRKGGMSVKFVQTSDNKYVQFRLMATSFSTTVSDWQGVDDEPTDGSKNLIESGGVADNLTKLNCQKAEVASVNLFNINDKDVKIGYYLAGDTFTESDSYNVSGFIPVKQNTTYSKASSSVAFRFISYYGEDLSYLSYESNLGSFTTPSGCSYVRITCSSSANVWNYAALFEGIQKKYEEYNPIKLYLSETNEYIWKKLDKKIGKNLLDLNSPNILQKKFITSSGEIASGNQNYSVSDYVEILPSETYHLSDANDDYVGASGYIAFYDSNKELTGSAVNTKSFTTPSGASFLRCTINSSYNVDVMLNKGSERGVYEVYSPIGGYPVNPVTNEELSNDCGKTQWSGKVGVSQYRKVQASLAADTTLSLSDYPYYCKNGDNVAFYAEFSEFTSLLIGKGYTVNYGVWLEIDNTNIKIVQYKSGSANTLSTNAHSLTFSSFVKVLYSFSIDGKLTYIVQTLSGMYKYTYDTALWGGMGACFLRSGSAMINIVLSGANDGFRSSVWCFGDSYFSYSDTRWPYYMFNWGYVKMLLIGISGGSSAAVKPDFARALSFGSPKFAVYCLGMNDGSDTNEDTPASTWLTNVQSFIADCISNGITPILSTIPTVPTVNNEGKSKWVRNSGYRYIDFYKAVGTNSSGEWYNDYLSQDGVHPAQLGGQALATQVLVDFPEIMW